MMAYAIIRVPVTLQSSSYTLTHQYSIHNFAQSKIGAGSKKISSPPPTEYTRLEAM